MNKKHSCRRKKDDYTNLKKQFLWKFNKPKITLRGKAHRLSKLITLCYKIYQKKTLEKEEKSKRYSKYVAETKRTDQKLLTQNHSS